MTSQKWWDHSKYLCQQKLRQRYLKLRKKKHDKQKFRDGIRSDLEKPDRGKTQQMKIHCAQVFKPTFHETRAIFRQFSKVLAIYLYYK